MRDMKKKENSSSLKNSEIESFVSGLTDVNVSLSTAQVPRINLKNLTRDLIEGNSGKFSFLINSRPHGSPRKIERVYSRDEIRKLVQGNLIATYQHENIIDAVTDYLYGIHVTR